MYKIIFGHCDIDSHMCFDFNVLTKTRKNHNFNIRPKKTRTNNFKFSFFNRYITDWNSILRPPGVGGFDLYYANYFA